MDSDRGNSKPRHQPTSIGVSYDGKNDRFCPHEKTRPNLGGQVGRTAFMAAPAALSPFSALCGESKSPTTPYFVADRVAFRREATGNVPRQPRGSIDRPARGPQHRLCCARRGNPPSGGARRCHIRSRKGGLRARVVRTLGDFAFDQRYIF